MTMSVRKVALDDAREAEQQSDIRHISRLPIFVSLRPPKLEAFGRKPAVLNALAQTEVHRLPGKNPK